MSVDVKFFVEVQNRFVRYGGRSITDFYGGFGMLHRIIIVNIKYNYN